MHLTSWIIIDNVVRRMEQDLKRMNSLPQKALARENTTRGNQVGQLSETIYPQQPLSLTQELDQPQIWLKRLLSHKTEVSLAEIVSDMRYRKTIYKVFLELEERTLAFGQRPGGQGTDFHSFTDG